MNELTWIYCSERDPSVEEIRENNLFICSDGYNTFVRSYSYRLHGFVMQLRGRESKDRSILAWMPMPEPCPIPPKEGTMPVVGRGTVQTTRIAQQPEPVKQDNMVQRSSFRLAEAPNQTVQQGNVSAVPDAQKVVEEERLRAEQEAARRVAEERLRAEQEAARRAEEERLRAEQEAARRVAEERMRAEQEAARRAEEERLRAEQEAARRAEEERLRAAQPAPTQQGSIAQRVSQMTPAERIAAAEAAQRAMQAAHSNKL